MTTILIADDVVSVRRKCSKILLSHGFEVLEAASGREAVKVFEERRPDGVLLDIAMPDMDGLTALKEIMKVDPLARVAMVIAPGQRTLVTEALRGGAQDVVVKPFDVDVVLEAVSHLLD